MAERINEGVRSAEEAERRARVLQEIEAHIEGMEDVREPAARLRPPAPVLTGPAFLSTPASGHQEGGWALLPLAWPPGSGSGVGIGHWLPDTVPPVPQLQAPQRRFLRQEMVIEVVGSVPFVVCVLVPPPACFVHTSARARCPRLSPLFHPLQEPRGRVPTLPPPLPLGCPLGRWGQEGGPRGLTAASGPTEGRRWQEGPVPLSVHGPRRLHHPEAEVRLPAAQLHESVSAGEGGAGVPPGPSPCPG